MSSAISSIIRPPHARQHRSGRRRGGFTLIELMVVVGILVLLAAILIPVVGRARGQAIRTVCIKQLQNLGQAIILFEGEHNSTLPTCGIDKPTYPNSTDWIGWGGMDTTKTPNVDYISECGLAKYLGFATPDSGGQPNTKLRSYYRCPSVTDDQRLVEISPGKLPFPYDYVFNAQLSGLPLDRIEKTSEKGLLIESDKQNDSAFTYWNSENIAMRHGGNGANCLFADGHVAEMNPANVGKPDPTGTPPNLAFTHWDAYYTTGSPPTPSQKETDPASWTPPYGQAP